MCPDDTTGEIATEPEHRKPQKASSRRRGGMPLSYAPSTSRAVSSEADPRFAPRSIERLEADARSGRAKAGVPTGRRTSGSSRNVIEGDVAA